ADDFKGNTRNEYARSRPPPDAGAVRFGLEVAGVIGCEGVPAAGVSKGGAETQQEASESLGRVHGSGAALGEDHDRGEQERRAKEGQHPALEQLYEVVTKEGNRRLHDPDED